MKYTVCIPGAQQMHWILPHKNIYELAVILRFFKAALFTLHVCELAPFSLIITTEWFIALSLIASKRISVEHYKYTSHLQMKVNQIVFILNF